MTEGRGIQSYFKTCIPTNFYNFKWTIENFSKLKYDREIRSPMFLPLGDYNWYATLVKRKTTDFQIGISPVNLYFYCSVSKENAVYIKVKIFNTKNDLVLQPTAYPIETGGATAAFKFFLQKKKDYLNEPYRPRDLVLLCEMDMSAYKIFTQSYTYVPRFSRTEGLDILSGSLKKIYESSSGADITLKVQGCNILVHKTILLARSDVFAKMFQSDMEENVTGVIVIDDIEPQVFKLLLEYLYTGVCPGIDFSTAQALYYAADKYCVLELKQATVRSLLSGMTVQNAFQLLSFADLHNDKDLQSNVIAFIKLHFSEIPILDTIRGGEVKILSPSNTEERK